MDRLGADGTDEHMADQPAAGRFKPHPPSRFYVLIMPFTPWRDGTLSTFGEGKEVMLFLKNQNEIRSALGFPACGGAVIAQSAMTEEVGGAFFLCFKAQNILLF